MVYAIWGTTDRYLGLLSRLFVADGLLLSLVHTRLVAEVEGMPRLLVQEVVTAPQRTKCFTPGNQGAEWVRG